MEALKKHADFTWVFEHPKEEEGAPTEGFYNTFITHTGNDALYLPSLKRGSILHVEVCL